MFLLKECQTGDSLLKRDRLLFTSYFTIYFGGVKREYNFYYKSCTVMSSGNNILILCFTMFLQFHSMKVATITAKYLQTCTLTGHCEDSYYHTDPSVSQQSDLCLGCLAAFLHPFGLHRGPQTSAQHHQVEDHHYYQPRDVQSHCVLP